MKTKTTTNIRKKKKKNQKEKFTIALFIPWSKDAKKKRKKKTFLGTNCRNCLGKMLKKEKCDILFQRRRKCWKLQIKRTAGFFEL